METFIEKQDLNAVLGKESTWKPYRMVNSINYVSGIPQFDALLNGKTFADTPTSCTVRQRPNGLEFDLMVGLKLSKVGVHVNNITDIHVEDKELVLEEKEKSVLGRALVGGLILGPVGAIVGGMTGIGTKKGLSKLPDVMITVKLADGAVIVFSTSDKKKKAVSKYLDSLVFNEKV